MWKLRVKDDNYYQNYLQILNGILKLTRTEISVLAQFMNIKNEIAELPLFNKRSILLSVYRKDVQEALGISEANLNNYIKTLKDKKMFINGDINPKIFIRKNNGQTISFKLELQ